MAFMRRDEISGQPTQNTFATGDRLYGAGLSNAATTGKLGSTGYAERSRTNAANRRAVARKMGMKFGKGPDLGDADPGKNGPQQLQANRSNERRFFAARSTNRPKGA